MNASLLFPKESEKLIKSFHVDSFTFEKIKEISTVANVSHNKNGFYSVGGFGGIGLYHYPELPKGVYFLEYVDGSLTIHFCFSMSFLDYEKYTQDSSTPIVAGVNNDILLKNGHWVTLDSQRDNCVCLSLAMSCTKKYLQENNIKIINTFSELKERVLDKDYFKDAFLCHQVADTMYEKFIEKQRKAE